MSVNKVILVGYTAADPQVKEFENGGKIARFTLVTNKRAYVKNGIEYPEKHEFHSVTLTATLTGTVGKIIKKGCLLYVEGELQTRKYIDKNMIERYTTNVFAVVVDILKFPKSESTTTPIESYTETEPSDTVITDNLNDMPF